MEDDSNEVSDTRGNEAGSKDEANNIKEQVGSPGSVYYAGMISSLVLKNSRAF